MKLLKKLKTLKLNMPKKKKEEENTIDDLVESLREIERDMKQIRDALGLNDTNLKKVSESEETLGMFDNNDMLTEKQMRDLHKEEVASKDCSPEELELLKQLEEAKLDEEKKRNYYYNKINAMRSQSGSTKQILYDRLQYLQSNNAPMSEIAKCRQEISFFDLEEENPDIAMIKEEMEEQLFYCETKIDDINFKLQKIREEKANENSGIQI